MMTKIQTQWVYWTIYCLLIINLISRFIRVFFLLKKIEYYKWKEYIIDLVKGKLLNPFRLKTFNDNQNLHRPKTASSFALNNSNKSTTSSKTKTATNSNMTALINRPTTAKSRSSNGSAFNANKSSKKSTSRKVELIKKPIENDERSDDNNEDDSQSCNLSLLSLSTGRCSRLADETRIELRKQYGKFRYTSFFERYMNQRATIKIPSHFIPK